MSFGKTYNRALQEQLLNYHEVWGPEEFQLQVRRVAAGVQYGLLHHRLRLKPQVKWLIENHHECQRQHRPIQWLKIGRETK